MKRNQFLDFMKGLCMIFIIVTHAPWTDQERLSYLFPFWIDMAVPILMIISGYVYALTLQGDDSHCSLDILTPPYLIKKSLRLTVPFVIAFVVEWLALLRLGRIHFDLRTLLVTFLQGGIGPGSYYYPVMMQFIFVAPLIYSVVKKYGEKGVVLCFMANVLYELLQRAYGMSAECYRLLLFRYTFLIAFGCFLALRETVFKKRRFIFSAIAGLSFQILTQYTPYEPVLVQYWTTTSCFSALYIIPIFVLLFTKASPNFSLKPSSAHLLHDGRGHGLRMGAIEAPPDPSQPWDLFGPGLPLLPRRSAVDPGHDREMAEPPGAEAGQGTSGLAGSHGRLNDPNRGILSALKILR